MKRKGLFVSLLLVLLLLCSACTGKSVKNRLDVPGALDRILLYEVEVSVNPDATLYMKYHIDWQVLDSSSYGPLEWVKIGIPNDYAEYITPLTDNINNAYYYYEGGSYVRIDFDRKYYKDEIVSFEFSLVQDHMYEMNVLADGETVCYFTPGWFDEAAVDKLVVKWEDVNAIGWSSGAYQSDGYIIWEKEDLLGRGPERSVTYASDAYSFGSEVYREDYTDYYPDYYDDYYSDYQYNSSSSDAAEGVAGVVVVFVAAMAVVIVKSAMAAGSYSAGSGFSSSGSTKKITRTLIKYYPVCPGCGAARDKNQENCEYCGRSFIESEEVIEEKNVENPGKYEKEGIFSYGSSPNTYIRVHVTHIPAPKSTCVHSSCAHSSCACAHSCACACACACAGGGRAGCSTKDFYNTGLKLMQFEKRKRK